MPYEQASAAVADIITRTLAEKPDALIALPAGRTPEALYKELVKRYEEGKLSFSSARLVLLTEFEGIPPSDEKSCTASLKSRLIDRTDVQLSNCIFPSAENIDRLDELISSSGGLDLVVLGLGPAGQIAYNEPTTQFFSPSHRQKLSPGTCRSLVELYGGELNVPVYAYTLGIRTIVSARNIVVMAFGEEKADAVFKMLYARDDSLVPAAFLQIPSNVNVYADAGAATKL